MNGVAMRHYYYLHVNGDLICKCASVVDYDTPEVYFDSDFVKKWWCLDYTGNDEKYKELLLAFLEEAKQLGARPGRLKDLHMLWKLK